MKFPRNARIFRGQLDAAPFAAVFFLLVMFLMLASLVYTPGVSLRLPVGDNLPGTDRLTVAVAVDANGRFYFENQLIDEPGLRERLKAEVAAAREPVTLLVQADKAVSYDTLIRLTLVARDARISEAWLATLPRPFGPPAEGSR